ncbi:MAG: hypothetical protein KGL04_02555, partial [Elusimicrobia bacterium]|nr:hypothetical protein [Elusimicrobiota bacterium]
MRYFVYKDSDIAGPYDAEELARLGADPDTLVYMESGGGGKAWRPLSEILGSPADADSPAVLPPIPEKNLDEMIADFDLDAELWSEAGREADAAPPLDVFLDLIEISPELGLPKADAAELPKPEAPKEPESETTGEAALLAEIARLRERLAALEKTGSEKAAPDEAVPPPNTAAPEQVSAQSETPAAVSLESVAPEPPPSPSSRVEPSPLAEEEIVFEAPKTFPVLEPEPAAAAAPVELESAAAALQEAPCSGLKPAPEIQPAAAIESIPAPQPAPTLPSVETPAQLEPAEPETRKPGAFEEELQKVLGPASGISTFTPPTASDLPAGSAPQPQSAGVQAPA